MPAAIAFKNGQVLFVGGQVSFGVNCCCPPAPPAPVLVESCDCCYTNQSRAGFVMPLLAVVIVPGNRHPFQEFTDEKFVAWFNANVGGTNILGLWLAGPPTVLPTAGGTFPGQNELGGPVTATTGNVEIVFSCRFIGGIRRFIAEVLVGAFTGEGEPNAYAINFSLTWDDGTCCGQSTGCVLDNWNLAPSVAIASGAGNGIAITNNKACHDGTQCQLMATDNCPAYAACNPLP